MTLPPPGYGCQNCAHHAENSKVTQELLRQEQQVEEAVTAMLAVHHERVLGRLADRMAVIPPQALTAGTGSSDSHDALTAAPDLTQAPRPPPPRSAFAAPRPPPPRSDLTLDHVHARSRSMEDEIADIPDMLPGSIEDGLEKNSSRRQQTSPIMVAPFDNESGRSSSSNEEAKGQEAQHVRSQSATFSESHSKPSSEDKAEIADRSQCDIPGTTANQLQVLQATISAAPQPPRPRSIRHSLHGHHKCELLEVWLQDIGGTGTLQNGDPADLLARLSSKMTGKSTMQDGAEDGEEEKKQFAHDVEEKDVEVGTGCMAPFIVHPYFIGRNLWDVFSLVLVLWDMVYIPLGFFDPPDSLGLKIMVWTTRLFWTFDMPLSFISGYVTQAGNIEMRPGHISRKYLRSWFTLDALVVGVDWFELIMAAAAEGLGFARFGKASRIFRILRMVRLLRVARMTEVLSILTERLDSEKLVIFIDVCKLVILMLGVGHMIACFWYAIGAADASTKNWLSVYDYADADLSFRYVMSLRWAISQFAGGMDEVTPKSLGEHCYAVVVYLTAFWSGAVFVSILTSSMTQWYIIGSQQAAQLTVLRRYLSQNGISKKLALRVQRNAKYSLAEEEKHMPETSVVLFKHISEPLKVELHGEMYNPMLAIHPFFARYMEECPHVVRKVCHTAMQANQVSTGDLIFNVGEIPARPKMFIINRGLLEYIDIGDGRWVVEPGQWVSEAPLWVAWTHRGTLKASEDCFIYTLDAKEFQSIVVTFEHIGFDPRLYARMFMDVLNEGDEMSDLPSDAMIEKLTQTLFKSHQESPDESARGNTNGSSPLGLGRGTSSTGPSEKVKMRSWFGPSGTGVYGKSQAAKPPTSSSTFNQFAGGPRRSKMAQAHVNSCTKWVKDDADAESKGSLQVPTPVIPG